MCANNLCHFPDSLAPHLGLAPGLTVTFSPHLRYNSPRLNDLAIRSNEYLTSKSFLLTTAPIRRYDFLCYLEETSLALPAAPALTLAFSIACSLLALFFGCLSFVFNSLQPLFPKYRGGGIPGGSGHPGGGYRDSRFSHPLFTTHDSRPTLL